VLKDVCRCGHDLNHFWVRPQSQWGAWSWLGIAAGVRAAPRQIDYACGRCGDVLARLTDPEALKRHR
jgi:hypothetical protein